MRWDRLRADDLPRLRPHHWDDLSRNALVENPFYSRQYVLAGFGTIDHAAHLNAFAVWADSGSLVGLFPFARRWGIARGARNLYQASGVPLVHRSHGSSVVHAWVDAIADGELPPAWYLRDVPIDSRLLDLMKTGAARRGLVSRVLHIYDRPRLTRVQGGFEHHCESVLSRSRRRDIQRSIRRLGEQGELRFERAASPDLVGLRLEQFLALEQAGWKGKANTAFLCRREHAAFARRAFGFSLGRPGIATIDSLLLDARPIALSINIASGTTAFTPKCTYDETFRRWGPGLVLEYLVIKRFYEEDRFDSMDAATTTDRPVVQGLWNETVPMGTLIIGKRLAVESAAKVSQAHWQLRSALKPAFGRRPRMPILEP